jgi:1,4-alpha-glucan branching enzyme
MTSDRKTPTKTTTRPRTQAGGGATAGGTRAKAKAHKFSIQAPDAHAVSVAGSFNNWAPQALKCNTKGVWSVSIPLPPGTHEYRFVVDSEWLEDPINPEKAPSPFGGFNSVCAVP